MKLQSILLGCGAALLLASPAMAGAGMYIGLGAGWDSQSDTLVNEFTPPPASGTLTTDDGLIVAGTLGYKMPEIPIRLEFESGYDWHRISTFNTGGASYGAGGHSDIASELFNAVYDLPLGPIWNLYGGAGLGMGHVWFAPYVAATGDQIAMTDKWGFMWQAIAGTSFSIAPDVDLFVDYRYRDVLANETSYTPAFGPVGSHSIHENVVMAGARFYLFPPMVAEEAPPPAPAYTPPPSEAPPPPPMQQPPQQQPMPAPSGGASSGGAGSGPQQ